MTDRSLEARVKMTQLSCDSCQLTFILWSNGFILTCGVDGRTGFDSLLSETFVRNQASYLASIIPVECTRYMNTHHGPLEGSVSTKLQKGIILAYRRSQLLTCVKSSSASSSAAALRTPTARSRQASASAASALERSSNSRASADCAKE